MMYYDKQPSQFTLLSVISAVVLITVTSAFAIVWLQQQISRTAQMTKIVELELSETMRKVSHLDAMIAARHQPAFLQGQVMGALRPAREEQIVWVNSYKHADGRTYTHYKPFLSSSDLAQVIRERVR